MPNEPASSLLAEQVRALETELAETRAAVAEFFQILPLAMLEIDLASLRVTYMNRLARIVLGYDPEAGLPGIAASEIVVPGEYERLLALTMQLYHQGMQPDGTYLRTGKQEIYETTGRRRDGSTFPANSNRCSF